MSRQALTERRNKIIEFLKEHHHLSNREASKELEKIGVYSSAKYIGIVRADKKSGLDYQKSVKDRLYTDMKAGMVFKSATDIEIRYNVSRAYANTLIKILMDGDFDRPIKRKEYKSLPPVRVNTFDHLIQQLTANDDGKRVA